MIKEYDIYVFSLLDDTHLEFNNDFSLLAVESMILIPMLWDLSLWWWWSAWWGGLNPQSEFILGL